MAAVKKDISLKWKYIHTAIGLAIMLLFPLLPPIGQITPIGMKLVGAFVGMVYLWSTVDPIWPSILGLVMIGLSGYAGEGYAGLKAVSAQAFGTDIMMIVLLSMVLFGAIEYVGCAQYIARYFLTRKIITGRPYTFLALYLFASYILSALIGPVTAILILWAIATEVLETLGVKRGDGFFPVFIVGNFFAATIGHPLLPFKSAVLMIVGAFEKITGITIEYVPYITFSFTMSMLLLAMFLFLIKFVYRPDLTKLKNIDTTYFDEHPLPPMNKVQKFYLYLLIIYVAALLVPSFLPLSVPGVKLLKSLGTLGVTFVAVVVASIVHFDGKQALPFKPVAAKELAWGVYFIIAAALYSASAVTSDATGVKAFLIDALSPILSGRSELGFALILFTVALIITNFANNGAMAVVLMPIIVTFCEPMGVSPVPYAMGVAMMVFVAMLTPAASPHSGMLHGRKDLVTTADIMRIGVPLSIGALLLYVFIGYPLAKIIFL